MNELVQQEAQHVDVGEIFENLGVVVESRVSAVQNVADNTVVTLVPPSIDDYILTNEETIEDFVEVKEVPTLPEKKIDFNLETVGTNEITSRFSGAPWFKAVQEETVILAGIGGIGSFVAFLLSRVNVKNLILFDDDIVESANLSGQLYGKSHVGKTKVNAMSAIAKDFSAYEAVTVMNELYTSLSMNGPIMICGFDSIDARKIFFNRWLEYVNKEGVNRSECLFIDGRLAMEDFQIFCIQGDDEYSINEYRSKYLFPSWQAEPTICSEKQTSFCANMIASFMVNLFINAIFNMSTKNAFKRRLPFFTYYDAKIMALIQK